MNEKFSFGNYLFKLKNTIVANRLLGILHVIAQICVVVSMLITGFSAFSAGFWAGLGMLLLMIILIPVVSIFVRFWFEMISVLFSINGNIQDIKKGIFGIGGCECGEDCDCEDCDCGEGIDVEFFSEEIEEAPKKKAPAKKWSEAKTRKAGPAAKKPAKKK